MSFRVWNTEKILCQQLIDLPTSPVSCSHVTLRNSKSHFSTIFMCICIMSEKNKVVVIVNLPITPENVTALLYLMQNSFVWCCVLFPSKVWWRLWKGRLCCVALVAVKELVVLFGIECQESNVTVVVQGDHHLHGCTLPVLYARN